MREKGQDASKFSAGGAVITYPAARLLEEVAFIAYYFHWPREDILLLPHSERQEWCQQITSINKAMNKASGSTPDNVFDI